MRIYDSLKTIHYVHDLNKSLSDEEKVEFVAELTALFHKKQVSEDGEYDNYKITKEDVDSAWDRMYGQGS